MVPPLKQAITIIAASLVAFPPIPVIGRGHDGLVGRTANFVENAGQWPLSVLYRTTASGATLFVERDGWTWSMLDPRAHEVMHELMEYPEEVRDTLAYRGHAWRVRFVDPSTRSTTVGMDRSKAYHNYFLGNDPSQWRSHVGLYGKVFKQEVWPGVDFMLKSEEGNFKYDVLLAPGADHGRVGMSYEGLEELVLSRKGHLIMRTSVGELFEQTPVAYYGDKKGGMVKCAFTLNGVVVGFSFPDGVDENRPIVIDPLLVGASFSGATGPWVNGQCATYDDKGNILSAGTTNQALFPTTVGAFQVDPSSGGGGLVLSKLSTDASELLWASYLDHARAMCLTTNSLGELIVLAATTSATYPTTVNALDNTVNATDIVVTHISADGSSLIGSTYVGQNGNDGVLEWGGRAFGEVVTDHLGNIYVASVIESEYFPTTPNAYQTVSAGGTGGVVFILDPTCSYLLASTIIGGPFDDNIRGMRLAENGDVIVVGSTQGGMQFPTNAFMSDHQGGTEDAFLIRLAPDLGSVLAGTYFGTPGMDSGVLVDLDPEGNVWVIGRTNGIVPIQPIGTYGSAGSQSVFLTKFDPYLSQLTVSTSLPSSGHPVAFSVDHCGGIHLSLELFANDPPVILDPLFNEGSMYVASFEEEMADVRFGSLFAPDGHTHGGISQFSDDGILYQGVCMVNVSSTLLPEWSYAPQSSVDQWDMASYKIDLEPDVVSASAVVDAIPGCAPASVVFENGSSGQEWLWDFGDGSSPVSGFEPVHVYEQPGDYWVQLVALDSLACNGSDTVYLPLTICFDPWTGFGDDLAMDARVLPNPSLDAFEIWITSGSGSYQLFDAVGSMIRQGRINAERTHITRDGLASGAYYLNVNGLRMKVLLQ
jgi:PKD domain